ncbi:reverse transcriptase domain-containing protein [Tanacetum coccineum]
MSGCGDNQKVKYTGGSFIGKALTWWNSQIYTRIREAAVEMSWEDFKTLTREEFCPVNEMQKLETEFWNHAMVGAGHAAYIDWFHELARLVPHLVTPENKRIERNGSLKKNTEKRGNSGETSRDRNVKDDNKRTRIRNAFATTANLIVGTMAIRLVRSIQAGGKGGSPGPEHRDGNGLVVRILLRIGKTLRVIGERPEKKMRHLRSAKTKEQKKEDIIVVRKFPENSIWAFRVHGDVLWSDKCTSGIHGLDEPSV